MSGELVQSLTAHTALCKRCEFCSHYFHQVTPSHRKLQGVAMHSSGLNENGALTLAKALPVYTHN